MGRQTIRKIVQANKRALKSIQARAKVNERSSGIKISTFPSGILSYFATIRKAVTRFKTTTSRIYLRSLINIPTQTHFFVKPLDGKGPVKQVNRRQMFDLGVTEQERREGESDQIEEDPEVPKAPVYHPRVKIATKPQGHQYHLRSKGPAPIPAPRVSRVRSQGVKLDQSPVASELLECSRL